MSTGPVIHVRCTDGGTWTVHVGEGDDPISTHRSETEAERAARRYSERLGEGRIVMRDRYRRTHVVWDHPARRHPSS
jgi:hypothetical protein